MMQYYNNYLRKRLEQGRGSSTVIDRAIVLAIDEFGAKDNFVTAVFLDTECYICRVQCDKKKRYCIVKMDSYDHTASAAASNAPTAEVRHLLDAMSEVPSIDGEVYVYGRATESQVFMHAVAEKFVPRRVVDHSRRINLKSRSRFSAELTSRKLGINDGGSILKYIATPLQVYVPDDKDSLNSSVYGMCKWHQLVPRDCLKCRIAETDCFCVQLTFEVDGFGNVFCRASDGIGHEEYKLIWAPYGYPKNTELSNTGRSSDGRPTARRPETEKQTEEPQGTVHKSGIKEVYEIKNGEIYTFDDLFGDYLRDAEDIIIEDRYIFNDRHFTNLEEFIKAAFKAHSIAQTKPLKSIKLITSLAKYAAKGTVEENKEATKYQKERLKDIRVKLRKKNVDFTYEFGAEFHDRLVVLSNGWYFILGMGLDFFNREEDPYSIPTCRETRIVISRNRGTSPERKNRKPESL